MHWTQLMILVNLDFVDMQKMPQKSLEQTPYFYVGLGYNKETDSCTHSRKPGIHIHFKSTEGTNSPKLPPHRRSWNHYGQTHNGRLKREWKTSPRKSPFCMRPAVKTGLRWKVDWSFHPCHHEATFASLLVWWCVTRTTSLRSYSVEDK